MGAYGIRVAVGAAVIGASTAFVAACLVACTHDFGPFEGNGGDAFDSGYDAGIDAACNPDPACTNNAKKCASDCAATEKTCTDSCGGGGGGGGGSGRCRSACQDAGAQCNTSCVGYCMTCANCNARAACTSAVGN